MAGSRVLIALQRAVFMRQSAITAVAIGLLVFFSVTANNFLTLANLFDIARGYSFVAIVAVGITYLLIVGELDLSVGSLYGFSGIVFAWLLVDHSMSVWSAFLLVLLMGAIVGGGNGFVTTVIGVPSFIVTLGMLSLLKGAGLILSGGFPIDLPQGTATGLHSLAAGTVGSVPAQALWALAALVVGALVLKLTPFGYRVYATGGNRRAARQAGINVAFIKSACFVMTGVLAALVGMLNAGWLSGASPTTGSGFELTVIAAVIVGGTALYGGEGSVYGTLVGAIILGTLDNGLILLGIDASWTILLTGAIVVVVGAINVVVGRTQSLDWLRRVTRPAQKEGA